MSFATSYINLLHQRLKENDMLYNQQGQRVTVPHGKELSESALRQLHETKEPLDHKGHKFFRLDQRIHMQ